MLLVFGSTSRCAMVIPLPEHLGTYGRIGACTWLSCARPAGMQCSLFAKGTVYTACAVVVTFWKTGVCTCFSPSAAWNEG